MIRSWEASWNEFAPFLESPTELRKIVCTTNAIESLNSRFRRSVRRRGHFPNEQATLKVLYLVATQRRSNRETMTSSTRMPSTTETASPQRTTDDRHVRLHKPSDRPVLDDL